MASYFFDSSGLVKRYLLEVGSAWVQGLTGRAAGNDLVLVRITEVEVVSALIRHVPGLPAAALARAVADFRADCRRRLFRFVAVSRALIAQAAQLALKHRLRGYDAIQLAAALETRDRNAARGLSAPTLVSADDDLNNAAVAEGFTVDNPNHHP